MTAPHTEAAFAQLQLCTVAANTSSYQRDRRARIKRERKGTGSESCKNKIPGGLMVGKWS